MEEKSAAYYEAGSSVGSRVGVWSLCALLHEVKDGGGDHHAAEGAERHDSDLG